MLPLKKMVELLFKMTNYSLLSSVCIVSCRTIIGEGGKCTLMEDD
uniref:Uncharacterized protein n=1 Tax=Anguilla anguilla TaxID=7936 RepID=A0A0E9QM66_ANGAN